MAAYSLRRQARLTPPQRQVAGLIARGLTNREIGGMALAPATMKRDLENIFERLGLRCRAELAARAAPEGQIAR